VRLPNDNIAANPGAGQATWKTSELALTDFIMIPNSLNNGALMPTSPGVVSFTLDWSGATGRAEVHDETLQVAGLVVTTGASIQWSGRNATGFSFTSDPAGQTALFAQVGHESNGVFFS
jgi:hypothetical protein